MLKKWNFIHAFFWFREALKSRSPTFFTTVNPTIEYGGMLNESKFLIYSILPQQFLPFTFLVDVENIEQFVQENALSFPFIIKPDKGQAGLGVKLIENQLHLEEFKKKSGYSKILIQEYMQYDKEYSILFYCRPSFENSYFSIVEKTLPYVIGDGKSTIEELINNFPNEKFRKHLALARFADIKDKPLAKGDIFQVDYVGAISKGTHVTSLPFGEELIPLAKSLWTLMTNAEVYFGRLDIKAASYDALVQKDFKVIELNGAKAEPLEIYIKERPIMQRIKILSQHWRALGEIARLQLKKGVRPEKLRECISAASDSWKNQRSLA